MPGNDGGRFSYYHIAIRLVCNLGWNNFHFNTMCVCVDLLAMCSFGTLILLSFNTDPPVKFFIVIILVVRKLFLFYRNYSDGGWGGEGG